VREVTLIWQDTACYGEDLDLKDGLALLLDRLAGHWYSGAMRTFPTAAIAAG
jgi:tRNA A37 methylthiotransferase MiaB